MNTLHFIEEWEKQVPGPAFLKKAKPLGTFKIQLEMLQGF